jgi:hypothetical protein
MGASKRVRAVWKFSRQFVTALVLATGVAFLGVGVEHSRLSSVVAPHVPVVIRPLHPARHSFASGLPPDLAAWLPVIQLLGLMVAVTLVVASADTVMRAARRR